jgi:glyoxylase-like metal-dependent hydrolase (beta-lactamase superfamily II)
MEPLLIPLRTPFVVGPVNCYLLPGRPLTLVDPGPRTPEALDDLEAGLSRLGLSFEQVELVILSHQHVDHVGNAAHIVERAGCRVAGYEPLADFMTDLPGSLALEADYRAEMMHLHGASDEVVASVRQSFASQRKFAASLKIDVVLADGDVLEAGGHTLRAHARPGHSPTDTIFVDEATRTALVGDHLLRDIVSNPIVHRPPSGPRDPRERPSTLATYAASLAQTAELGLDLLFTGHGEFVLDPATLVAERLARQGTRRISVLQQLGDGPRTARDVTRGLWGETADRHPYLTLCEVLGALDGLVEDGRAREIERNGTLAYEPA